MVSLMNHSSLKIVMISMDLSIFLIVFLSVELVLLVCRNVQLGVMSSDHLYVLVFMFLVTTVMFAFLPLCQKSVIAVWLHFQDLPCSYFDVCLVCATVALQYDLKASIVMLLHSAANCGVLLCFCLNPKGGVVFVVYCLFVAFLHFCTE